MGYLFPRVLDEVQSSILRTRFRVNVAVINVVAVDVIILKQLPLHIKIVDGTICVSERLAVLPSKSRREVSGRNLGFEKHALVVDILQSGVVACSIDPLVVNHVRAASSCNGLVGYDIWNAKCPIPG